MGVGIVDELQDMGFQDMLVQDNRSRRKREEVKESNHRRDNRERNSCLVVLLHNLKAQSLVSLQKNNMKSDIKYIPHDLHHCITLVSSLTTSVLETS